MNNESENGLSRTLGLFPLTNIVIANMIGAGIFTTSGLLMQDLNSPFVMLLLWIAGGIIALCGALCYSELGAAMPYAGGEYIFLSKLFHPISGFLSGWVSFFVGFSAPIAASAIGFSEYIYRVVPGIFEWGNPDMVKKLYSIIVIVVFTYIHFRGIEFGAKVQNYLTLLKVVLIAGLIVIGFTAGDGNINNIFRGSEFKFSFSRIKVIGLSLMWISFSYSGWNASAYIGSEVKDPEKTLPRSLILGTVIVTLLYFLLNVFYVYAVDPQKMKGVISIGGLAVGSLFGPVMENLFSIFIAFALFSSLSAFIILGPRVYYSMAKDGYFFRFVADIHPVFRVPWKSIMLQGSIAAVMVMSGAFEQILTYMSFSLGIFPPLAVMGAMKLRYSGKSKYKMPGFPVIPVVYLLAGFSILVLSFLQRPAESTIAVGTVLVGIPVYMVFKKKRENTIKNNEREL